MSFFDNAAMPKGLGGMIMTNLMNLGHGALTRWGLSYLDARDNASVLDCGCGGGAALRRLLKLCPQGHAAGVDYSDVSVRKSRALNQKAVAAGRCTVLQASVAALPFEDAAFDAATAFETVYFWPELAQSFREIHRVLKPDGVFLICNECGGDAPADEKWPQIVEGMTVYRGAQLKAALEQARFIDVQIHKNARGWLCVTARKSRKKLGE